MKKVNISARRRFLLSFNLLCSIVIVQGQQLDSLTEIYFDRFSQERIYLHFDKSSYANGETVWFKVYMMNATLPADLSKTAYLDWFDNKGNILSHDAFPLVDGISNGQFNIPQEYAGTSIHVKGYTKMDDEF